MAIDESAGIRFRKDRVFSTAVQSYVMACLLEGPEGREIHVSIATERGLVRRGFVEMRPRPDIHAWATRMYLTAKGREAAQASPAVKEWIEDWEYYRGKQTV